jgi:hypothetical protein
MTYEYYYDTLSYQTITDENSLFKCLIKTINSINLIEILQN